MMNKLVLAKRRRDRRVLGAEQQHATVESQKDLDLPRTQGGGQQEARLEGIRQTGGHLGSGSVGKDTPEPRLGKQLPRL